MALKASIERSSTKFVLVAMANLANEDMTCWPSIPYLCEATSQDRKTVIENLKRLRETGFIRDTGERRGATGNVPIYALCFGATVPKTELLNSTKNGTDNGAENGTIKDVTVPFFPSNSTVFPDQQSRFSHQTVPKTVLGTVSEPSTEPLTKKPKAIVFDPLSIELPDCIQATAWAGWVAYRRAKKIKTVEQTWRAHIEKLESMFAAGNDPAAVIKQSIEQGWQGLFELKNKPKAQASQSRHTGFENIDYRAGVAEDGRF